MQIKYFTCHPFKNNHTENKVGHDCWHQKLDTSIFVKWPKVAWHLIKAGSTYDKPINKSLKINQWNVHFMY